MPVVEQSIEIFCDPEDIFAVVTDVAREPDWLSAILDVRGLSDDVPAVGSTFIEVASFMAKTIETPKVVTDCERPTLFRHRSTGGPVPQVFTVSITPIANGGYISASLEAEPGTFFGALPEFVLIAAMKVFLANDLKRLKGLLEH